MDGASSAGTSLTETPLRGQLWAVWGEGIGFLTCKLSAWSASSYFFLTPKHCARHAGCRGRGSGISIRKSQPALMAGNPSRGGGAQPPHLSLSLRPTGADGVGHRKGQEACSVQGASCSRGWCPHRFHRCLDLLLHDQCPAPMPCFLRGAACVRDEEAAAGTSLRPSLLGNRFREIRAHTSVHCAVTRPVSQRLPPTPPNLPASTSENKVDSSHWRQDSGSAFRG